MTDRQKVEESRTLREIWKRFEGQTFSFGKTELALCKAYEDAIRSRELELEKYRWIPVSERLPEDGDSVLIFIPKWEDEYLRFRVAWIDYDDSPPNWIHYGEAVDGVTHWMRLPEAPKEGL